LNGAPKGVAGELLKVIRHAVEEAGEIVPGLDGNVRGVSRSNLKKYCTTMGWQSDRDDNSFRAAMSNNLSTLREAGLFSFNKEWVWPT
jgi:hypothetical protein